MAQWAQPILMLEARGNETNGQYDFWDSFIQNVVVAVWSGCPGLQEEWTESVCPFHPFHPKDRDAEYYNHLSVFFRMTGSDWFGLVLVSLEEFKDP